MNHTTSQRAGFSLIEVVAGMAILATGLLTLASATTSGKAAMDTNRESELAAQAVKQIVENLENSEVEFEQLFANYTNGLPDGAGGFLDPDSRAFDVRGLESADGTAAVELFFPMVEDEGAFELREDEAGRDLNGDGDIDEADHAEDYKLLPVTIRVSWTGLRGPRAIEREALLTRK